MSCVTVSVTELGTFLDPKDRYQTDILVDIWDGRREIIDKYTKGNGKDHIENAWVSLFAGTTRVWIAENLNEYSLQGGLFSRIIWLYADRKEKYVSLPHRCVPKDYTIVREKLIKDLQTISKYAGEYKFTTEAEEWMDKWYVDLWSGKVEDSDGRITRMQTHLVKLAMVISAARFEFPRITVEHLEEADTHLREAMAGVPKIISLVGQTAISRATQEIVDFVQARGSQQESLFFRNHFMRKMSYTEFKEALGSAIESELVKRDVVDGVWCVVPLKENQDELEDKESGASSGG